MRLFIVLNVFVLISCGQKNSGENSGIEVKNKELPTDVRAEQALYDEVMDVHDVAMPKMSDMMRLKGELLEKIALLRENDGDQEHISELETAVSNLEESDEAMMQWMRNFEPRDYDSLKHESTMKYYEEQKTSIISVHQEMQEAMVKAQELLKE